VDERGKHHVKWYAPTQRWPEHPKKFMRELLDEARGCGWHLLMLDGHDFGKIVCDRAAADRHEIVIFSTGTAAEHFVKKKATSVLRKCHHNVPPPVIVATRLLDGADRLLDAAEHWLDAAEAQQRAMSMLEDAAAAPSPEAEDLFDDAVRAEREAANLLDETRRDLAVAGAPDADTPADVVETAARAVSDARGMIARERRAEALRERIAALRSRIRALRQRLR
jgi:polyhydroxyalkanoate synthesis regulator phasin